MNDELEYRGYVFVNSALSSIQKGVQGAHAMIEVTEKYQIESNEAASALHDWRESHKTLIFLDAGFHQGLLEYYLEFASYCEELRLPHALFVEDAETMNNMATAFAGVIPSDIYEFDLREYDLNRQYHYTTDEPPAVQLCRFLNNFRLAG